MRRLLALLSSCMVNEIPSLDLGYQQLETAAERMNSAHQDASSFVKALLGEQKVNLTVYTQGGQVPVMVDMQGIGVHDIREGRFQEPTMNASIDHQTIVNIVNSPEPYRQLKQAVRSERVEYEPLGRNNRIKFQILEIALSLSDKISGSA